jgi:hypothetical protein
MQRADEVAGGAPEGAPGGAGGLLGWAGVLRAGLGGAGGSGHGRPARQVGPKKGSNELQMAPGAMQYRSKTARQSLSRINSKSSKN